MKTSVIILLVLLLFRTGCSFAAETDSIPARKKVNLLKPIALGVGGLATWGLTYRFLDTPIRNFAQSNQSPVPGFIAEYAEPMGKGKYHLPLAGGMFLAGVALYDRKLAKAGAAAATAFFINRYVSSGLKSTFERRRPNSGYPYNTFEGPNGDNQNRSLPSSHTSNVFTTATVIASVYKDNKWVPPVAYGLASLVAFSRVYQDHHWASDVLAGAAVGFACGKISVAGWNWIERKNLLFIPSFGRNKNTVTLLYKF